MQAENPSAACSASAQRYSGQDQPQGPKHDGNTRFFSQKSNGCQYFYAFHRNHRSRCMQRLTLRLSPSFLPSLLQYRFERHAWPQEGSLTSPPVYAAFFTLHPWIPLSLPAPLFRPKLRRWPHESPLTLLASRLRSQTDEPHLSQFFQRSYPRSSKLRLAPPYPAEYRTFESAIGGQPGGESYGGVVVSGRGEGCNVQAVTRVGGR